MTSRSEQLWETEAKERATCSGCLARTYRQEECVCEDGGDAEDFDIVAERLFTPAPEPMPGQTALDAREGWDG